MILRLVPSIAAAALLVVALPCPTAAAAAAPASESRPGAATGFPSRPMRIILGFPPGSSTDLFARFLGAHLTERFGQQAIVDNRAGANGIIAAELATKANPDGHTVLLMSVSHTMNAAVYQKLPFDAVRSFTALTTLGSGALVLVAYPGFAPNDVKQLIALAAAKPNTVNYAIAGTGGINHFSAALFARMAKVQLVSVPYKGGAAALTDVIGGQVPIMFGTLALGLRQVRAGKLKALGVTSKQRSPHLPEVPTIAEAGVPGYEIGTWWGLVGPAGIPAPIAARLTDEIAAILKLPDSAKRLEADGAEPWILPRAEFARLLVTEVEKWKLVAREANIKVD